MSKMFACSLILLGSLACLGAAHPVESGKNPQGKLMIEKRAVEGASFYRAPLRKQECENCNKLIDEQPEVPQLYEATPELEGPTVVDDTKNSRTPKDRTTDDDDAPAPRKGGKPSGSVYKNFFPMTFGARVVRDVLEGSDPDAQANAKAVPEDDDDDEHEDEDEDDEFSPRSGEGSHYENFFPMTFAVHSRFTREAEAAEGGRGGSVISIANSFSKGRGAVATSSATAYGSPSTSIQPRDAPPAHEEPQE